MSYKTQLEQALYEDAAGRNCIAMWDRIEHGKKMIALRKQWEQDQKPKKVAVGAGLRYE